MDWSPGFLLIILLPFLHTGRGASAPCQLRAAGGAGVCVCNATYCDALDAAPPPPGAFHHVASSRAGLRFRRSAGALSRAPPASAPETLKFSVNPNSTYQTIIGFGGAFTDSAGINILSLSAATQENLLRSYFSPEGIEFSVGRVPIAGSDFSTRPYTYDDVPGDEDLSQFRLASEDTLYKIPLVRRARALSGRGLRLVAAAWSAPPWMKSNGAFVGLAFLRPRCYASWARYHLKFLRAYKAQSIDIWAISTGNEPSNGIIPINRFNSLGWTPQTQSKWLAENLGPVIKNSEFNQTKILALDDQRFMLPWWIKIMMENKVAAKYIDGIAVHWYWDSFLPASLLTATHNKFPDKFILSTEASQGDKPWDYPKVILGSWKRAEDYMADIIQDMNHWVSGWVDWNLALDLQGGPNWAKNFVDAAVIVNKSADEFYKQPMFYALGHFSKFVAEGSVRVAVEPQSLGGVATAAFSRPDGRTAVVLHNSGAAKKSVTVEHLQKGSASVTLPAFSFNTLVF